MYFPVGWPKVLQGNNATVGNPVKIFRHRSKDIVIELRTHSVAFWHTRLCVLLSSYVRSKECIEKYGPNIAAAIRADGTVLVIATAAGNLLFLRLLYETVSSLSPPITRHVYTTREHGIFLHFPPHLDGAGEGRELEVVQAKYLHETAVLGGVNDLLNVGTQLMVSTRYGILYRLSWEGCFSSSLAINLNQIPFTNDLLPDSRSQHLSGGALYAKQIVFSPILRGFSLVLSDGRGAFLTGRSVRYEPQRVQGVWLKGVTDAVCTAVNPKYTLLAFGKTNGSVEVYGVDETTGEWSISHTLQFTRRQFPETGMQLGEVQSMEWSVPDAMVIAVSWKNGGLSLWSVFGSLLLCSLGDQPGTPSPFNPHCTILETLCWSSDGYHLWMLPTSREKMANHNRVDSPNEGVELSEQVLVMQFMRNSIVSNPIVSNHHHLFLQGSDRLYLNVSRGVSSLREGSGLRTMPTDNGMVSSPQWKVIPLPASYMTLNWPIQYAAVSHNGLNLAVSGKAGFALYSASRRKWKLFGNEVQEQSLICRGGFTWYHDVLVFPCRVQEKTEEVRFYSLHSNLDNSQLLNQLRMTSPIIKLNIHSNHLFLASRDCHMTVIGLKLEMLPNKGLVLSLSKVHELSLAKSLPSPWIYSLISMVPSNIRTEPVNPTTEDECLLTHRDIDSVFFNIGGKVLMIQQDLPSKFASKEEVIEKHGQWAFSDPVCLAASVEAIWTPLQTTPLSSSDTSSHLLESVWFACGWVGIKVWLPLFPRDEGHLSFVSKRIMLTIPCSVYTQVVMFADAVLFGLSHETAFSEKSLSTRNSFPFATIERTTIIFLHQILRQLLRRNLGSHALQIAQSFSHLPYFSHVLELMLHEILEEEAPGTMPVPDALLPRVVEFIKQFPEFLETVGHCARKTEVALWQYLFAAVGNPRDLFELCITDGRLQTAATYLIIIQNLEASSVSRQLASRLLDAALESNNWNLCTDLVRFLRAIGSGDSSDVPILGVSLTPHKAQTPTSAVFSSAGSMGGTTPSLEAPDLDRSAVMLAKDHLSSGSTSSCVSLSGDYKDASGKVIRRPHFLMEMESREDYFIELILSRHARKLLTVHSLRDLGRFAAYLDFLLPPWLARERLRAAKIDNFPFSLKELHKEFQWPFPPPCHHGYRDMSTDDGSLFSPSSTIRNHSPKESTTPMDSVGVELSEKEVSEVVVEDREEDMGGSIKRSHRPPNLDLSPSNIGELEQHNVTLEPSQPNSNPVDTQDGADAGFDPTHSSTPTRNSGSISERVSLIMKKNPSSLDLESSSMGDILEESDWDFNSEVAVATGVGGILLRGSSRAEKEIRYFVEVMMEAGCVDWTFLLSTLLLDSTLVTRAIDIFSRTNGCQLDRSVVTRNLKGIEDLRKWAESECSGYLPFLDSLQNQIHVLSAQQSLASTSPQLPESQTVSTPVGDEQPDVGIVGTESLNSRHGSSSEGGATEDNNSSMCILS